MFWFKSLIAHAKHVKRFRMILDSKIIYQFRRLHILKRLRKQIRVRIEESQFQNKSCRCGNAYFVIPRFQRWKLNFNSIVLWGNALRKGQEFRRMFHKRLVLKRWKQEYVEKIKKSQQFLSRVGYEHYCIKLILKYIAVWRERTRTTRIQIIDIGFVRHRNVSSLFWTTIKLRQFIRLFHHNAQYFRERRYRRRYTYKRIYSNFMNHLAVYSNQLQESKYKLNKAMKFFKRNMNIRFFYQLQMYYDNKLIMRYQSSEANIFRRKKLLKRIFTAWLEEVQDLKDSCFQADVYHDIALTRRAVRSWHKTSHLNEWLKSLIVHGEIGRNHRSCVHVLQLLGANVQQELYFRDVLSHGDSHYYMRLIGTAYEYWHEYYANNKHSQLMEAQSDFYRIHRMKKNSYKALKFWFNQMYRQNKADNKSFKFYRLRRLKQALHQLKSYYGKKIKKMRKKIQSIKKIIFKRKIRSVFSGMLAAVENRKHSNDLIKHGKLHFKYVKCHGAIRLIYKHNALGLNNQRKTLVEVAHPYWMRKKRSRAMNVLMNHVIKNYALKQIREKYLRYMVRFLKQRAIINWKKLTDNRNRIRRVAASKRNKSRKRVLNAPKQEKLRLIMEYRISTRLAQCGTTSAFVRDGIVNQQRRYYVMLAACVKKSFQRWVGQTLVKGSRIKEKLYAMELIMEQIRKTRMLNKFKRLAGRSKLIEKCDYHYKRQQFRYQFVRRVKKLMRCRLLFYQLVSKRLQKHFSRWKKHQIVTKQAKIRVTKVLTERVYRKQIEMFNEWVLITTIERTADNYVKAKLRRKLLDVFGRLYNRISYANGGRYGKKRLQQLEHNGTLAYQYWHLRFCLSIWLENYFVILRNRRQTSSAINIMNEFKLRKALYLFRELLTRRYLARRLHKIAKLNHSRYGIIEWFESVQYFKASRAALLRIDRQRNINLMRDALLAFTRYNKFKRNERNIGRNWKSRHKKHQMRRALQHLDTLVCAKWGADQEKRLLRAIRMKLMCKRAFRCFGCLITVRRATKARLRKEELTRQRMIDDVLEESSYVSRQEAHSDTMSVYSEYQESNLYNDSDDGTCTVADADSVMGSADNTIYSTSTDHGAHRSRTPGPMGNQRKAEEEEEEDDDDYGDEIIADNEEEIWGDTNFVPLSK